MNEQKIELTLSLINSVMQYLGTRPYAEVVALISAIQEQAAPQLSSDVSTATEIKSRG